MGISPHSSVFGTHAMNQRLPVFAERNSYPHLYLQLYQTMSAVQQPAFSSSEALFTINNYTWIYMYTRMHQCMRTRSRSTGHAGYSGSGCGLDQATPTYDTYVLLGFKILARTLVPLHLHWCLLCQRRQEMLSLPSNWTHKCMCPGITT